MTTEEILEFEEGFRPDPYLCPSGKLTIGIGRAFKLNPFDASERKYLRLDQGRTWEAEPMTHDEAVNILRRDIKRSEGALDSILTTEARRRLPQEAKDIVTRMVFQMGASGVRGFGNMRKALEKDPPDFLTASDEMLDSEWHYNRRGGGTPARAKREAARMKALA